MNTKLGVLGGCESVLFSVQLLSWGVHLPFLRVFFVVHWLCD